MFSVVITHVFFFFNDTATTEIYTLSLHDALPISCPEWRRPGSSGARAGPSPARAATWRPSPAGDRKSTRLNSSHLGISYAVFCLKKKKHNIKRPRLHKPNIINLIAE